jgi:hypothetical protein
MAASRFARCGDSLETKKAVACVIQFEVFRRASPKARSSNPFNSADAGRSGFRSDLIANRS